VNALSIIVVAASAVVIGFTARAAWLQERRERLQRSLQASAFRRRPKGVITQIGTFKIGADGKPHPWGFGIDCRGCVPDHALMHDGEKVHELIGGWTEEELAEIAARRQEFEP